MIQWLCDMPRCLRDCLLCSRVPFTSTGGAEPSAEPGPELQFPSGRRGGGARPMPGRRGGSGGRAPHGVLAAAAVAGRGRRCHVVLRQPPQGLHRGLGQLVSAAAPGRRAPQRPPQRGVTGGGARPGLAGGSRPAAVSSGGGRAATRCRRWSAVPPGRGGLWVTLVPCGRAPPAVPGGSSCPDSLGAEVLP